VYVDWEGVYGKPLYLLLNFLVKVKLFLKNETYFLRSSSQERKGREREGKEREEKKRGASRATQV
jgi:hypothetical protein